MKDGINEVVGAIPFNNSDVFSVALSHVIKNLSLHNFSDLLAFCVVKCFLFPLLFQIL